jgi:hypothetical protein
LNSIFSPNKNIDKLLLQITVLDLAGEVGDTKKGVRPDEVYFQKYSLGHR